MKSGISREDGLKLLKEYNKEEFHIRHALTLENVMGFFAEEYDKDNLDFWKMAGLLHDVDYERYPEEHLKNTPEILREAGGSDELIHAIMAHGSGICSDVEPELFMEKILFASDELTGLIYAASLMRPSKSTKDMNLKSVKKKFKDKKFAEGCSRDVIKSGAEKMGWELDELIEKTLLAMQVMEDLIEEALKKEISY
ncbi:MAG: HDIG domain-containing protein [Peptoniphilus harei]|uniref:HDIG domain-containing metalloprotein n=1 Tax=Peptoniphilus harei TaxID=54005 RepID=UPI00291556E3|nr:HDIG domain-containing metalloprotein [Peptoniphilus harei]MDU5471056.1 HDIG domain-containing protein [Peptoniphilus harei]MDU6098836.1 HDIG domain-containing protein [Peptoniphilus harei]